MGGSRLVASLLFAGAVVLLLVAGVNLGGLLAARAARRGGEVALRLGLGASTRHLVRQFVAEGLVLATVGTIAGITASRWRSACARSRERESWKISEPSRRRRRGQPET